MFWLLGYDGFALFVCFLITCIASVCLLTSLSSTLQFIISPLLGRLSDRFGRKRILMMSMVGNILSAIV